MPILIERSEADKIGKRRPRKFKTRVTGAQAERRLKKDMSALWREILFPATERIKDLINSGASGEQLASAINRVTEEASLRFGMRAKDILERWQFDLDNATKLHMQRALSHTLGVDILAVLDTPHVADAMAMGSHEAASLITSIPQDHLEEVRAAVMRNVRGEAQPEGRSLMEQIDHIGKVGYKRSKLIARDQTNKMLGHLVQTRQQAAGIEEYIWRTVKDNRVVGKPGGRYPEGNSRHMDHYAREGKRFRWDSPPEDGKPGFAIQCRCYAQPVIDIGKIREMLQTA